MKEKVICIVDSNEKYVTRLVDYINGHKGIPYKAHAFTSADAFAEFAGRYFVELLLIDENECDRLPADISFSTLVKLVDKASVGENEIYRFQVADYLVKDILSFLDGDKSIFSREGTICSVYSPATKCFKSSLAIGLAMNCAKRGKTLLLNFEQYSGLHNVLPCKRGGLSKALYYYSVSRNNMNGKILGCLDSTEEFDYLSPVGCPEDIAEISQEELVEFCKYVKEHGGYKYVIIDVGDSFTIPWGIFDISTMVFVPQAVDVMGRNKLSSFLNYLDKSGKSVYADKIRQIEIPFCNAMAGYEISPDAIRQNLLNEIGKRCEIG